jgi:hypothetical protein
MSNYVSVYCGTCDVWDETDINYGWKHLQACAKVVSLTEQIYEKVGEVDLTVELDYYGSGPLHFMIKHKTHVLYACSEYGLEHDTTERLIIE